MSKSTCPACHGRGEQCDGGKSAHPSNWHKCQMCNGTGQVTPKSKCPLCDDGWPLTEIHGEMIHELPEPAGNFTCFATRKPDTIPLVYIMSPYTNPDPEVMEQRFNLAQHYEQLLTVKFPDALFYSPIAHFHPIALEFSLPRDIEYWRDKNRCMIHRCQLGIILRIEGWRDSEGMSWEHDLFDTLNTPYVLGNTVPTSEHKDVGQALQELA